MKIQITGPISTLWFFSVAGAVELSARDFSKYDEKLRHYQNLTGITEQVFQEIWDSGISNRKF